MAAKERELQQMFEPGRIAKVRGGVARQHLRPSEILECGGCAKLLLCSCSCRVMAIQLQKYLTPAARRHGCATPPMPGAPHQPLHAQHAHPARPLPPNPHPSVPLLPQAAVVAAARKELGDLRAALQAELGIQGHGAAPTNRTPGSPGVGYARPAPPLPTVFPAATASVMDSAVAPGGSTASKSVLAALKLVEAQLAVSGAWQRRTSLL